MTAHDHSKFVEGCYRCDLSRDEVSGYSPTTEEVLGDEIARVRHGQNVTASDLANRLMPWLAAHDAEQRAEWEAEQGTEEPEWEYGFTSNWGTFAAHDRISAEQQAATIRTEIEAGRSSGDLKYHGRVMKRTTVKAGPWMPVEDPLNVPDQR